MSARKRNLTFTDVELFIYRLASILFLLLMLFKLIKAEIATL